MRKALLNPRQNYQTSCFSLLLAEYTYQNYEFKYMTAWSFRKVDFHFKILVPSWFESFKYCSKMDAKRN